jgi:hypothetical protein
MRNLLLSLMAMVVLTGCPNKNPLLDQDPKAPQSSTINVTVLNVTTVVFNKDVILNYPNGSQNIVATDSNGIAAFPISGTGVYTVGLAGQTSVSPVFYTVNVQEGQTLYGIALQTAGAAFSMITPFGQGNGYGFSSASKTWTINYLNNSDLATDLVLDLDPAFPTPAGWTASISPTFLVKGQSALLNIVIPQGSQVGNVTLRVRAKNGAGALVLTQDLTMPQDWSFKIRRTYSFDMSAPFQCSGANTRFLSMVATAETVGVPSGILVTWAPAGIGADGCSICGPMAQTLTGWTGQIPQIFYPGVINGFTMTPATNTVFAYRSNNQGACGGSIQSWGLNSTWSIGGIAKSTTDTVLVNMNLGAQNFTIFN